MKRKEIKTERLTLGPITERDRAEMKAILTDAEVSKTYMIPEFHSEEEVEELFTRYCRLSASERFVYGVFLKEKLIGFIHETSVKDGEVELGYVISPSEKGKGYATEALRAAIDVLFEAGFRVVKAGTFEENGASLRVMEKAVMQKTGETEEIEYRGKKRRCLFCAVENGRSKS